MIHIAGYAVTVGAQHRQRCSWCGAVLIDDDLSAMMVPEGQTAPAASSFPPGVLVAVEGVNPVHTYVVAHTDGERLPATACAQLPHEVTA